MHALVHSCTPKQAHSCTKDVTEVHQLLNLCGNVKRENSLVQLLSELSDVDPTHSCRIEPVQSILYVPRHEGVLSNDVGYVPGDTTNLSRDIGYKLQEKETRRR